PSGRAPLPKRSRQSETLRCRLRDDSAAPAAYHRPLLVRLGRAPLAVRGLEPQRSDRRQRLLAVHPLAYEPAADNRACPARAAPAVEIDRLALERDVQHFQQLPHLDVRRAGEVADREAPVRRPPGEQFVVGRKLALLGEIEEGGHAGGAEALEPEPRPP